MQIGDTDYELDRYNNRIRKYYVGDFHNNHGKKTPVWFQDLDFEPQRGIDRKRGDRNIKINLIERKPFGGNSARRKKASRNGSKRRQITNNASRKKETKEVSNNG